MQTKNESENRLATEIKLIPAWAWVLATLLFIAAQVIFNVVLAQDAHAPAWWIRALLGVAGGVVLACYVLFIGYVGRDARTRGMSAILWTVVAIFIPHGLGILLYFILRQPRGDRTAVRATGLGGGSNPPHFCPNCRFNLSPSCPQCRNAVGVNDRYCPVCGNQLHPGAAGASPTQAPI